MAFPNSLITLPPDHPLLANVPDDDVVLRRFNPDNREMVDYITEDEGQVPRVRLKTSALTGFREDGCSVGRDQVLRAVQIPREEMLLPKYQGLAEAAVDAVRGFNHPDSDGCSRRPFDVVADPYPEDDGSPHRWLVAHALITLSSGYGPAARKTAVGTLARVIFNPLEWDNADKRD